MKNTWIGSLCLLLLILPLAAQQAPEKLRVVHSDKLFLDKINDEQVMRLDGNVHFWYGETEFKCDRAMIFDLQKIARLDGNVRVSNDSLALNADSLSYYRIPDELNAGGKVYITEERQDGTLRWFRSQYAIYKRKANNLTVWNNVSAQDTKENATATCGYAFWDRSNGYAYMIESPRVESAAEDTLLVTADKIEFFDGERKLVATFNVEAQSSEYQTSSDFLIYFIKQDKAVFTGRPQFRSDYANAGAREFYLYFQDRKLSRAELVDSCLVQFAEERLRERINWVKADYITLEFRDEMISAFEAEGTVSYNYVQDQTEERDFIINTAEGDFLEAKFNTDNELESVKMRRARKGFYKFNGNS